MTGKASTMGERIAAVETWIDGHEERCEERYDAINGGISDLKETLKTMRNAAWAIVIALLAWTSGQLYSSLKHQTSSVYVSAPTSTAPAAPR